jgi:hypothetical protein
MEETGKTTDLSQVTVKLYHIMLYCMVKEVSSINKTDNHDITEILLKEPLNTINLYDDENNLLFYEVKILILFYTKILRWIDQFY